LGTPLELQNGEGGNCLPLPDIPLINIEAEEINNINPNRPFEYNIYNSPTHHDHMINTVITSDNNQPLPHIQSSHSSQQLSTFNQDNSYTLNIGTHNINGIRNNDTKLYNLIDWC
jgi:hypothetical protein